ncbi:hypothetical protein TWF718_002870 [Orbilia javanica]|uniref:Uncharacterized protein n=1 Tax=Orbilia javanica TaxID=47235 RepID=A0AAN8MF52_9PEZI
MDETMLGAGAKYPQDWTAEEVVAFLSKPRRPLPIQEFFRSGAGRDLFIDNCITGAVLLDSSFTKDTLKNELGIKKVGLCILLWNIIQEIRRNYPQRPDIDLTDDGLLPPPTYEEETRSLILRDQGFDEGNGEDEDGYRPQLVPETKVLKFGNIQRYDDEVVLEAQVEWSGPLVTPPSKLVTREAHTVFRSNGGDVMQNSEDRALRKLRRTSLALSPASDDEDDLEVRNPKRLRRDDGEEQEASVQRVTLHGSQIPEDSVDDNMGMEPAEEGHPNVATPREEQPDYHIVQGDLPGMENIPPIEAPDTPRLRLRGHGNGQESSNTVNVEPTIPSPPRPPRRLPAPRSRRPRQPGPTTSYLNRTPLTASDMALVGDEVDDEGEFLITKKSSPGTSMGAARILNAFLHKKSEERVTIDGRVHHAYRHHTLRHLHRFKRDPITIISEAELQVGEDIKAHIADFPGLDVRGQLYRRKSDRIQLMDAYAEDGLDQKRMDPWQAVEDDDYFEALGKKYDNVGEYEWESQSDSLEDDSSSPGPGSDAEGESNQEPVSNERETAKKNAGNPLTAQEMKDAWEEVKTLVVTQWQENTLPKLEEIKYDTWVQIQRQHSREQEAIYNRVRVRELEERLYSHLDGYLKSNWYSAVELRKFMKAKSRTTIQDREKASWWSDVFKGKRPAKPGSLPSSGSMSQEETDQSEGEDPEDEAILADKDRPRNINGQRSNDSENQEPDIGDFVVADTVYDEGHEGIRAENDAVLAKLKRRYFDDESAAGIVLEADDEEEEKRPKPKRKKGKDREPIEPSVGHANEDTELPDAETEAGYRANLFPEAPRKPARASSDSFRWFSNERTGIALRPDTAASKASVAGNDKDPATPPPESNVLSGTETATPTPEPSTVPRLESVTDPATETIDNPSISTNNANREFGDTGPFVIEQGTPQPIVKAEGPVITNSNRGFIDLTDDTPVSTPPKPAAPGPSEIPARGQVSPIDLDEDTQIQIAILESRETARKEGVELSPPTSPVDRYIPPQSLLAESSSAASSSATRARPRITKRPTICAGLEGITSPWKKDLQAQYNKDPQALLTLWGVIKAERKRYGKQPALDQGDHPSSETNHHILSKVIGSWDVLQHKQVDTHGLGIKDEDKPAYEMFAKLYSTYGFPHPKGIDYKYMKKLLNKPDAFSRFLKELTAILTDVAEYEESMTDTSNIGDDSQRKGSQAASTNPKRPINLESETNAQVSDIDNVADYKGKGRAKQGALATLLESDPEDDPPLSQRSLLEVTSEAEASRSGTSTPRRQKINRIQRVDQETQRVRQQNDRERHKLMERERRGRKAGQTNELINFGHLSKDDPIYFPASDQPLYDFQKAGVKFMWRNIVVSEKRTGALLAHNMGLGKTRQVITLLCAIADAASSDRPQVRNQIPQELRNMRALIVCPPGLISNWYDEILKWADGALGTVHRVTQALSMNERIDAIEKWSADGMVLIIGYESFSQLCSKALAVDREISRVKNDASTSDSATKDNRIKELETKLVGARRIEEILLDTPTIVVADEAHKIKNKNSKVSQTFGKFKSRSRIAMTGSPLANDLAEYFHIMQWVDREYAGDEAEFNNNFKLPIRDGLFINSLDEEVRESNKKQKQLIGLWGPKMHRINIKDIEGLGSTLPQKTEFLITLPLTDLQHRLYSCYAKEAKRDTEQGYYHGFFDFVAQLSVLLNHPALFWKAFEKRQTKKKSKIEGLTQNAKITETGLSDEDATRDSSEEGEAEEDLDSQKAILGADNAVSDRLQAVITATENLNHEIHSYRIQVLLKILDSCIKIREKVLVFSQSVETLKYIGEILDQRDIKFVKITGVVSTAKRQTIAKGFNNEDSDKFVFLISTKAGGLGLNIQAASRVVVFDSQFSPQDEEQAVGRAYRLGQKKHVFVYRFRVGGTFEDVIHNNSILKMSLAARLVDKTTPARRAKKSEAADWFKAPSYIPKDHAGFEGMRGKDPKVMDKFLDEDWLRGLVTQDMYEEHYEEVVAEDEGEEPVETAVGATRGGLPVELRECDEMDIDDDTTATATTEVPKKPTVATKNPAVVPKATPTAAPPRNPIGKSSLRKQVTRTPKERDDFRARMQQLSKPQEGGTDSAPSPSIGIVTPSHSKPAPSAEPSLPTAGPSTARKGSLAEPKERTEQANSSTSTGKDQARGRVEHAKGIDNQKVDQSKEPKRTQRNSPVPVPPSLVIPSQASPRVLPSQRDRTTSAQSPVTPTAPLADRAGQRQPGERSPRPYSSVQNFSQPRGAQPVRTQRRGEFKKPYERPEVDRRASAQRRRQQENDNRHAPRPHSPQRGTPQRRSNSERDRQRQQPQPGRG